MGLISKFIQRWKSTKFHEPVMARQTGLDNFRRQIALEDDGRKAAIAGRKSTDNPYCEGSFEWNHWKFGFDIEASPLMCRLDGSLLYTSTDPRTFPKSTEYLLKHRDGTFTTPDGNPVNPKDAR